MSKSKTLTTAFGMPVGDDLNSLTAGKRGPVLMQDVNLLEKLAHFDRERIPERVVHAKGAGAGGYFEVTADATKYTKAKFLSEIGKRTEVFMRFDANGGGGPNYWPNSFGGPAPDSGASEPAFEVSGQAARTPYSHPNDDFVQAGNLYRDVMTDQDRDNLVGNIVDHLGGAQKRIQLRQTAIFFKTNPDYGRRVAEGLGPDVKEVEKLAEMSQEERFKTTSQ